MVSDGLELPATTDDEGDGEDKPKKFLVTESRYFNQDGLVIVERELMWGELPPGTPRFIAMIPAPRETVANVGTAQLVMKGDKMGAVVSPWPKQPPPHPPLAINIEAEELEFAVLEAEEKYKELQDQVRPQLKQAIFTGQLSQANKVPLPPGFKFDPGNNGQPPLRF